MKRLYYHTYTGEVIEANNKKEALAYFKEDGKNHNYKTTIFSVKLCKSNENIGYRFEINDLIALIYIFCVGGIILGFNTTPLFLIGCVISIIACLNAKKINLLAINLAFVILNVFYLIQMF